MSSEINPKHYDLEVKGHKFEVADLMEAHFAQDAHLAQAFKYLMRAGRKADASYVADVGKCLWWCAKSIMFHGGTFELPEGSPFMPLGVITHKKKSGTVKSQVSGRRPKETDTSLRAARKSIRKLDKAVRKS